MKKSVIKAEKISKSYAHNGHQNHVLNQVSLELYEKDFTVIMGPSGSGKSTLLYSLSGMDNINSGHVYFKEQDIATMSEHELARLRKESFGFIFQQMHLVNNLTLYENVAISGYLKKELKSKEVEQRSKELLEKMGLKEKVNHLPSQVSGGEQQRAAIARAVIAKPSFVFADEPTGALNRKNAQEVLNLLSEINEGGQSILMVTHDQRCALRGNRILYIEDGRIIGDLSLPPYRQQDEKAREIQVNAWLSSMEW